ALGALPGAQGWFLPHPWPLKPRGGPGTCTKDCSRFVAGAGRACVTVRVDRHRYASRPATSSSFAGRVGVRHPICSISPELGDNAVRIVSIKHSATRPTWEFVLKLS